MRNPAPANAPLDAHLRDERAPGAHRSPSRASAGEYLGPASVVEVRGHEVRVQLPSAPDAIAATMALAFPYQPAVGDSLLVIGRDSGHYVIGVLSGQGKIGLHFQGDVSLSASGSLSLEARETVRVRGEEVSLEARVLKTTADTLVQKLTSVYQRVSALLSVRAREMETIVDEGTLTRAKSATVLTEESMTINGKQIHLG